MNWFEMCGFVPRGRAAASPPPRAAGGVSELAVRIVRGGVTTVDLSLPARVIERLGDLLDEELLRRIGERGVDLAALRQASLDGRLVAGTIFSDDNGQRRIDVRLQ